MGWVGEAEEQSQPYEPLQCSPFCVIVSGKNAAPAVRLNQALLLRSHIFFL